MSVLVYQTQEIFFCMLTRFGKRFISTANRLASFKQKLNSKGIIRAIEAHSGLSAMIAEKAVAVVDGKERRFDALWSSSLTSSTVKGKPDIEVVDLT